MTATLAGDHLPTPDARSLMFWSTENDRVIAPLPMLEWSTVGSRILALTPDGSTAAFCADGRTLRVWSVGEARETANVGGGKRRIHGLLATPDGATLVVWLGDGSIELRSLPGGELQATLSAPTRVHVAAVTPDGLTLVTGHPGGVIALWDLEKREARGYLFDPAANQGEGLIYSQFDANTGRTLTYTLPCGSPIPSGATCTCNCVPGRYRPEPPSQPPSGGGGGGGGGCICNTICTCIPVFR
jgi:WD40 repeat protein